MTLVQTGNNSIIGCYTSEKLEDTTGFKDSVGCRDWKDIV